MSPNRVLVSFEWAAWVLLMLLPVGMSCARGSDGIPAAPLRIAAAADLAPVLPELIALHGERHPGEVATTLGSSGLLARQIAQGAPFDLFFSANVGFVDDLIAGGHGLAETRALYGRGRIVLWEPAGSNSPVEGPADLLDARFQRIAIAQPEHAPYGLAAKQALERAGLWETLEARIVYGDNVLQTLQLAHSGNAELAIVALSLAIPTPGGRWRLVPDELHAPIDQGLVVTTHSRMPAAAEAFARTVASPAGRAILARFGFVLPGEALDPQVLERSGGALAR